MTTAERASCEKHLLRLGVRQHGVVTRRQAMAAGVTKSMLQTRVRSGRLRRIHPGVYGVAGTPRTAEQRAFAAAAWGGETAVVSHASAGHLWRMIDESPECTEISSSRKLTRAPHGVCPHFTSILPPRDRGRLRNIPITSPVRTLIDLAGTLPERETERALHHAIVDRRVTAHALWARLRTMPAHGLRGPAVLRRLLQGSGRLHVTSPLERSVAQVLATSGLPAFRRECPVYLDGDVYYLDFALPHLRVGVEADGRRWHSDGASFERDRLRHNALTAAGWRVLRVTERQVRTEPARVRERVRSLVVRG